MCLRMVHLLIAHFTFTSSPPSPTPVVGSAAMLHGAQNVNETSLFALLHLYRLPNGSSEKGHSKVVLVFDDISCLFEACCRSCEVSLCTYVELGNIYHSLWSA